MQTLQQGCEERELFMPNVGENLTADWLHRLSLDYPHTSTQINESIIRWLFGKNVERFEQLNPTQLEIAQQAMDYRYRILRQRYLGVPSEKAYSGLMTRLSSLVVLRHKILAWIAISRDRTATVVNVLQEVIQELLQSDRYMKQQMAWIHQCTSDRKLQNALLFATIEDYCLRPIRNRPLITYRFFNYVRSTQLGGLTHVPTTQLEFIRLVSEEIFTEDSEDPVSLLNQRTVEIHQDRQALEELQAVLNEVKEEFSSYLTQKIGPIAAQWLQLYLQGWSQEAIAQKLDLDIKQVYRLREKIRYHAMQGFAKKAQPNLVSSWLEG